MTEMIIQVASVLVMAGTFVGSMRKAVATVEKRLDRIELMVYSGLERIAALEATRKP